MVVKLSAILLMCLGDLVLKEVVSNAYPSMNVPFFMVYMVGKFRSIAKPDKAK